MPLWHHGVEGHKIKKNEICIKIGLTAIRKAILGIIKLTITKLEPEVINMVPIDSTKTTATKSPEVFPESL